MEFVSYLTDENVLKFFLLFARLSGIFAFFPIYGDSSVPISIKSALVFYLTILFFPLAPELGFDVISPATIIIATASEILLGFLASFFVNLAVGLLNIVGEHAGMYAGFAMSTIYDPTTSTQVNMITRLLTLTALLVILLADGHHLMILFANETLLAIKLGGVFFHTEMIHEFMYAVSRFFMMGFSIIFPIMTISLMADMVFGMISKTIPSFNIITLGFQIKIIAIFGVFVVLFSAIFMVFRSEYIKSISFLSIFFK